MFRHGLRVAPNNAAPALSGLKQETHISDMEQREVDLGTYIKADTGLSRAKEKKCTSLFRNIMRIRHHLYSMASQVAGTLDLRGSEMAMIDTLGKHGPLAMNELADACFFSPPNATYTVVSLENKGLVKRERSSQSHRVVIVHLTRNGERLFKKSYPSMLREVDGFLDSRLTRQEAETLDRLLQKLTK